MTTRNQPQELGPIPGCLCDLGISHPDIEPCNTPEISPVGGEFEICLGCGHDADCHAPQCVCAMPEDEKARICKAPFTPHPASETSCGNALGDGQFCAHDLACHGETK